MRTQRDTVKAAYDTLKVHAAVSQMISEEEHLIDT